MLGLGLAVVMVQADIDRLWRLLLFFPFMFTALNSFQGLYRTCPMHTKQKTRVNAVGDEETVANPEELSASQNLARRVLVSSLLSAVGATGLVFLIP